VDVIPLVDEGLGNSAYVVELAAAGARLLAPAGSVLAFEHQPLRDGDELDLGGLTLEAIATPGHTPEHLAYVLRDAGQSDCSPAGR
jgi:glyoxylase-like metal-dependent hydrolase (beta-lactamase superfamily II)